MSVHADFDWEESKGELTAPVVETVRDGMRYQYSYP
jgi:hypothetical protein